MEQPVPTTDDVMSLLLRIPASADCTNPEALALHVAAYERHGIAYMRDLVDKRVSARAELLCRIFEMRVERDNLAEAVRDQEKRWKQIEEQNAQDRRVERKREQENERLRLEKERFDAAAKANAAVARRRKADAARRREADQRRHVAAPSKAVSSVPAPLVPKLPSAPMWTLEEAKRHVRTYGLTERLGSLIMLLKYHLVDLQKRDKGDYLWSNLTASGLYDERTARESLFKWFESELLNRYPDDGRIKNLGYGFYGLCQEVNSRISMLPTAPTQSPQAGPPPVGTTPPLLAEPTPGAAPAPEPAPTPPTPAAPAHVTPSTPLVEADVDLERLFPTTDALTDALREL